MHCKDSVATCHQAHAPVFEIREYILETKKVGGRRPQKPHDGGVELVATYLPMIEGNNIHL